MARKRINKKGKKKQLELEYYDENSDETFAYIAGYTSGGAPYGVTWEEDDEDDTKSNQLPADDNDGDLPFRTK